MHALVERIVTRLYREGTRLSRNKNFVTYQDPRMQRAARIARHLKSLESDLLAYGGPDSVTMGERTRDTFGQFCVQLTIDVLNCRRTAFLRPYELELLRENPSVSRILATCEQV